MKTNDASAVTNPNTKATTTASMPDNTAATACIYLTIAATPTIPAATTA